MNFRVAAVNEKMVHAQNYGVFREGARNDCGEDFRHPAKAGLTFTHCRCAGEVVKMVEGLHGEL